MSFDRLRIARAGLLIGWILISMLAVAGFAAFTAEDEAGVAGTGASVAGDVGRTAGAVSALAFVGSAQTTPSTSPFDVSPYLDSAELLRRSPATTAPAATDRKGGVYVRSGYLSETEVREIVGKYFDDADVNRAIRVAWCVSAFNPAAVNPASGASGLFQHLPENWAEHSQAAGRPDASIFDAERNVAVAAWMLYELPGGWSHWDCSP